MAVTYTADGENFAAGKPQLWAPRKGILFFVAHPDGKRVVVAENEASGKPEVPQVVFLQGFYDDLRRRVPTNTR